MLNEAANAAGLNQPRKLEHRCERQQSGSWRTEFGCSQIGILPSLPIIDDRLIVDGGVPQEMPGCFDRSDVKEAEHVFI